MKRGPRFLTLSGLNEGTIFCRFSSGLNCVGCSHTPTENKRQGRETLIALCIGQKIRLRRGSSNRLAYTWDMPLLAACGIRPRFDRTNPQPTVMKILRHGCHTLVSPIPICQAG